MSHEPPFVPPGNGGEPQRGPSHGVAGRAGSLLRRLTARRDPAPPEAPEPSLEHILLDRAADATVVLDRGGIIRYASSAAQSVLGHRRSDLVGMPLRKLAAPESMSGILGLLDAGTPAHRTRLDSRIRHRDGHWLSLEAVVTDLSADPQVGGLVVMLHDVSRWQRLEEQLTRQAFHDPLTGLPNRALFIDRLEHALGRRRRPGKTSAVMFLDLDDFKSVNDSLGHVEGDILISLVAGRLSAAIRPEDTAARLGGDEFALLIEDVDEREAVAITQRILEQMEPPFELTERSLRVGASIGLALSSARVITATDMLRAADIAMYTAKEGGKGHFRIFQEEMQDATAQRLRLAVDIRGAVDRSEFVLHYLPTVLLPSGTIVGMEALVRWDHPERGLLAPADFIPLAESTSQIVALGEWVLGQACRQARAWKDARPGQAPLTINVNLSGVQLQHPGLVTAVTRALEESGLPPEELMLEVPETDMARETDASVHRLRQLKSLGVGIAIDDFGTGLSSLAPITVVGTAYQDPVAELASEWQLGDIADLAAGLREMDARIDVQLGRAQELRQRSRRTSTPGSVSSMVAPSGPVS